MGKSNLVIDKEQKKVLIDGEVVGSVGKYNLEADGYLIKINNNKLFRFHNIFISDILNNGASSMSLDFRDDFLHFSKKNFV